MSVSFFSFALPYPTPDNIVKSIKELYKSKDVIAGLPTAGRREGIGEGTCRL